MVSAMESSPAWEDLFRHKKDLNFTTSDGKTLGDLKEERDDIVRFIILRNYPYLLHENCIVW